MALRHQSSSMGNQWTKSSTDPNDVMPSENEACMANQTAPVLYLPPEILAKIFSSLPVADIVHGVRPTCRTFYQVSLSTNCWQRVSLHSESDKLEQVQFTEDFVAGLLNQKCTATFERSMNRPRPLKKNSREPKTAEATNGGIAHKVEEKDHESTSEDDIEEFTKLSLNDHLDKPLSQYDGVSSSTVKDTAVVVKEHGEIWPSCSITGQVFYPRLKSLSISGRVLPQVDFLSKYPFLCSLELGKPEPTSQVSSHFIANCFKNFKSLTSLTTLKLKLYFRGSLSKSAARAVRDYFRTTPALQKLSMDIAVDDGIMICIFDHCLKLERLKIYGADVTSRAFFRPRKSHKLPLSALGVVECASLDDECLKTISASFPCLQEFKLTVTEDISEAGMTQFLRACSGLVTFKLMKPRSFPFEPEEALLDGCCLRELGRRKGGGQGDGTERGQLQKITLELEGLEDLTSDVLFEIFQFHTSLKVLDLTECAGVDDDVIYTLAKECNQLESVHLFWCGEVTATALLELIRTQPRLHSLDKTSPYSHDIGVFSKPTGQQCSPPDEHGDAESQMKMDRFHSHLRDLSLGDVNQISTPDIEILVSLCPHLVSLHLEQCSSLTDDCMEILLRGCPNLQTLILDNDEETSLMTDASLEHVLKHGSNLRMLMLDNCWSFTSRAIACLVVHSRPCLADVTISTCIGEERIIRSLDDLKEEVVQQLKLLHQHDDGDDAVMEDATGDAHVPIAAQGEASRTRAIKLEADMLGDDDDDFSLSFKIRVRRPRPGAKNELHWLKENPIFFD